MQAGAANIHFLKNDAINFLEKKCDSRADLGVLALKSHDFANADMNSYEILLLDSVIIVALCFTVSTIHYFSSLETSFGQHLDEWCN